MRLTTEVNFEKATSQNLPLVDFTMFCSFLSENICQSAESRGVKAGRYVVKLE